MNDDYQTLQIVGDGAIFRVFIDNSPINLIDTPMITDLNRLDPASAEDTETRVMIFDSAN